MMMTTSVSMTITVLQSQQLTNFYHQRQLFQNKMLLYLVASCCFC